MGAKIDAANKFKAEMSRKWDDYFEEHGLIITPEVKKAMDEDNKKLEEMSKEAMSEWMAEPDKE